MALIAKTGYPGEGMTYTIDCPPGMLHARKTRKRFTSVTAFDGYIGQLRRVGRVVDFVSPTHAVLAPLDFPWHSGVLFMFASDVAAAPKGGQAERRTPEGAKVLA